METVPEDIAAAIVDPLNDVIRAEFEEQARALRLTPLQASFVLDLLDDGARIVKDEIRAMGPAASGSVPIAAAEGAIASVIEREASVSRALAAQIKTLAEDRQMKAKAEQLMARKAVLVAIQIAFSVV